MSTTFLDRGGLWMLGQNLLLGLVAAGGIFYRNHWHSAPVTWCGALLLLSSAVCGLACAISLGRNLTPFPKPARGARLVQTGIYRLMRHPLYLAVFCAAVGWALFSASWPALLGAMALAPVLDAKARREERWLRHQFPEYACYERRVRRFIPLIY